MNMLYTEEHAGTHALDAAITALSTKNKGHLGSAMVQIQVHTRPLLMITSLQENTRLPGWSESASCRVSNVRNIWYTIWLCDLEVMTIFHMWGALYL